MDSNRKGEEYIANEGRTDYVVTRSRKFKIISFIVSLLAAIVIWCIITITNTTTTQIIFNSVKVSFKGEEAMKEKYGLIVRSASSETISVTVVGDSDTVGLLSVEGINPQVDLSSVDSIGVYSFPVTVSLPNGINYTLSQNVIEVAIDKPEQRVIEVESDSVQLTNWIKDPDCTIVDQSINISKIILEGNTTNLDRVAGVQIKTAAIGLLNSSISVSAQVYLLDEQGAELDIPVSITTDAGKEGIVVNLTVFKEKSVGLSVQTEYGYFDENQISVSPSTVRIYGEASEVNKIETLQLDCETINEKQIFTDSSFKNVGIKNGQELNDIIIKNEDGSEFVGADVNISLASCESALIIADNFELIDAPDGITIEESQLLITVRALNLEDAPVLLRSLASKPEKILLIVNCEGKDSGKVNVVVVFSDEYKSYVYEVGQYSVTLTESQESQNEVEE